MSAPRLLPDAYGADGVAEFLGFVAGTVVHDLAFAVDQDGGGPAFHVIELDGFFLAIHERGDSIAVLLEILARDFGLPASIP